MKLRIVVAVAAVWAVLGGIWWYVGHSVDPREVVVGDWRETSSRLRVEVTPDTATARGLGRYSGSVTYEWVETEREPYRVRFVYRRDTMEALIYVHDRDTLVVEPLIWDKMPASVRSQIREVNRARKRPEQEIRLLFNRVNKK